MKPRVNIFWFRRDLRLEDNAGLYQALQSGLPVLPLFIFDRDILDELDDRKDRRVNFIYSALGSIQQDLVQQGSTLEICNGNVNNCFRKILEDYEVDTVFTNHDYEPYAIQRDQQVRKLLQQQGVGFRSFKDQVIFEKNEVVTDKVAPYRVFTPYARKWMAQLLSMPPVAVKSEDLIYRFLKRPPLPFPSLQDLGFEMVQDIPGPPQLDDQVIGQYHRWRDIPSKNGTTRLSVHLRFGTIGIRTLALMAMKNRTLLNELVWREFFMQLLWHFPQLVSEPFKKEYARIQWRNDATEFEKWCQGETGYPIVDAGMRELDATGFMHNRVRMITASFLVKHLLVDWRWGEAWFARKLVDYELASNNGNWQWVAGCGADAAPYFRIFNPLTQAKKFDPEGAYIRKWVPEFGSAGYPSPMVAHEWARERCLNVYKAAVRIKD